MVPPPIPDKEHYQIDVAFGISSLLRGESIGWALDINLVVRGHKHTVLKPRHRSADLLEFFDICGLQETL
jgi:hypothetical protein